MSRERPLTTSDRGPHPPTPPGHRSKGILWGRIAVIIAIIVGAILLGWAVLALMDDGGGVAGEVHREAASQHLVLTRQADPEGLATDVGLREVPIGFTEAGCAGSPVAMAP